MATGYVGPALARTMADRGFDLVLQGADEGGRMGATETPFSELVPDLEARRPATRQRYRPPSIGSADSTLHVS
jgi:hypothetical protein